MSPNYNNIQKTRSPSLRRFCTYTAPPAGCILHAVYVQCTVVAVLMLKFVRTRYVVNIYLAMQTNLCIDDYVTTFELLVVSLDLIG
jgi:hypothetical protein